MERIHLKSQADMDQAGQNIELRLSRIRSSADRDVVTVKHQISLSHRDVVMISQNQVDIARKCLESRHGSG